MPPLEFSQTHTAEHILYSITPVLAALHWLPIKSRIDFKILLMTYKALNGLAPLYIKELLPPKPNVRTLRSSDKGLLDIPSTNLVTKGDRAFAVVAPRLWNALPLSLKNAESVEGFKNMLKTHLFRLHFGSWFILFLSLLLVQFNVCLFILCYCLIVSTWLYLFCQRLFSTL